MPLLDFRSVDFTYDEKSILSDINCQFNAGEMVGLIGPNGAGKSTLLKLIMANVKANQGEITLQGKPIRQFSRRELAQKVSLVPQDTDIGYAFSIEEVVAMGRNPHLGRFEPASKKDLDIIQDALQQTGLQSMATRMVNTLSGGERQRVLIARSITQQTPIILFDEATSNLDICHQLEVLELAQQLAHSGRLVICAIHDLNMAARFFDRLILLANNSIQADDKPVEVLTEINLKTCFDIETRVRVDMNDHPNHLHITPLKSLHPQNH